MVEPDLPVSGIEQGLGNRLGLCMAPGCVCERCLIDQALMFLEGRDVGIAKNGKPVGAHGYGGFCRFDCGSDGLMRQAVDEVEIDTSDTGGAEAFSCSAGLLWRLNAVDRFLHFRIKALYA
ncbi:hypothetical protein D3C73_641680 [compost metagenome]